MAFLDMYDGKINSPITTITSSLSDVVSGTVETVDVGDGSYFPAPPGLATIGNGPLAETVLYTDITNNTLTIERGFEGETSAWSIGTPIGRFFTAYDHRAFKNNINELDAIKANQTGTYASLRAQATTKDDVGLGSVDNVQQAPLTHVGAVGTAHGAVTTSTNGFMLSTDKTKLNGIESGATADQTAAQIRDALKTVDGSGSGVDADLLDGVHASAFQLAGTYNTIIGTDTDINTSGATIIDSLTMTDGVITAHGTRVLTLADLGYTGATNANYFTYTHPSYNGDDFSIDTGHLAGATVIDDIDINLTTDTQGHVVDANATVATRNLTAANIGAATSSHTHDSRYFTEAESNSLFLNESSNLSDLPNKATARANLEVVKTTVSTTAPSSPSTNDIWIDISS